MPCLQRLARLTARPMRPKSPTASVMVGGSVGKLGLSAGSEVDGGVELLRPGVNATIGSCGME